jgi:hypothetical protein
MRWKVAVNDWNCGDVFVDAKTQEEAETLALKELEEVGTDAYKWRNGGYEILQSEPDPTEEDVAEATKE